MALNNVMPLYPQTQPPGPHSHPSGKHKEGECWIKRRRAQGSCCSSVADEPRDLDRGHFPALALTFPLREN